MADDGRGATTSVAPSAGTAPQPAGTSLATG